MPSEPFRIPILLDCATTLLWAFSGALVAVRRGLDIMGVAVLAFVTALGGGLIRDGLLLHQKPVAVTSPYYLPIIAGTALLVGLLRIRLEPLTRHRSVDTLDALGMGAYAVVGMQMAMGAGFTAGGVILTGLINAVGGGILRDMMVREVPAILMPSQYYSLSVLAGCVLFWLLAAHHIASQVQVAWITVGFILALRLLTIRFNWRTRALHRGGPKA